MYWEIRGSRRSSLWVVHRVELLSFQLNKHICKFLGICVISSHFLNWMCQHIIGSYWRCALSENLWWCHESESDLHCCTDFLQHDVRSALVYSLIPILGERMGLEASKLRDRDKWYWTQTLDFRKIGLRIIPVQSRYSKCLKFKYVVEGCSHYSTLNILGATHGSLMTSGTALGVKTYFHVLIRNMGVLLTTWECIKSVRNEIFLNDCNRQIL